MDPNVDMGTVIDEAAAKLFERARERGRARRARKLLAGNERSGALYSPTVIDRVHPEMNVVQRGDLRPGLAGHPLQGHRRGDPHRRTARPTACRRRCAPTASTTSRASSRELNVGTVNVREVPGYRLELTPFGGIKDSGLGYKEGVQEAMKSFTNVKTYSLPW